MNWKLLLVIAGLTLTTSLTACSKKDDAAAPDATKTETKTETTETKPATGDAKPADGMKPADAPKGDTTKTTKTETTKPADAPKKP